MSRWGGRSNGYAVRRCHGPPCHGRAMPWPWGLPCRKGRHGCQDISSRTHLGWRDRGGGRRHDAVAHVHTRLGRRVCTPADSLETGEGAGGGSERFGFGWRRGVGCTWLTPSMSFSKSSMAAAAFLAIEAMLPHIAEGAARARRPRREPCSSSSRWSGAAAAVPRPPSSLTTSQQNGCAGFMKTVPECSVQFLIVSWRSTCRSGDPYPLTTVPRVARSREAPRTPR